MQILLLSDLLASNQSAQSLPSLPLPCVLTIGNFDGVHLGHQTMIYQVLDTANSQGLASAVMVFEPQPREFFSPSNAPARLTNLAEKQQLLSNLQHNGKGLDYLIVAGFDDAFRSLSANEFAQILLEQLNVKILVLGDDFRFGHDRTGDSEFLRAFGFVVNNLQTIKDMNNDNRISSTHIRACLAKGQLDHAHALLGHEYFMLGTVTDGDKIGRTLNFPTANIALNRLKPAVHGVFGVSVRATDGTDLSSLGKHGSTGLVGLSKGSLFGACNVGTRPTLNQQHQWRLEVHFPKFDGDLYGQELLVTFLHFLHGERRYSSLDALKAGIDADVHALLAWREGPAWHERLR